jgi:hypothetical protein
LAEFCEPDRAQQNLDPQATVTTSRSHKSTKETVKTIACGTAGLFWWTCGD